MMQTINWQDISLSQQHKLLQRPTQSATAQLTQQTQNIIDQVRQQGDQALYQLTEKFDHVKLTQLSINNTTIEQAAQQIPDTHRQAIDLAATQLTRYHQAQTITNTSINTCEGVNCQRQAKPIRRVGLYVPGGSAPLVSTVMMLAIPAHIANCPLRILATPPNANGNIDPHLLYAAALCGIEQIYSVGGAQAIAAMAYGTETIPKVDKLFGPGNAWVTQAKTLVAQDAAGASCDLPAGPSELLIIADQHANAEFVAADLLSQAEHGPDSQVILVTDSETFASQVTQALNQQLSSLPRKAIAEQALQHSCIIITDDLKQAINISNQYAPEHLTLNVNQAEKWANQVECAGAVFIGAYSAEALGDYVTGSNHVLPTYGYARNTSGLSVADFMTIINFQTINAKGLQHIGPAAEILASIEGLHAHQRATQIRLDTLKQELELNHAESQ